MPKHTTGRPLHFTVLLTILCSLVGLLLRTSLSNSPLADLSNIVSSQRQSTNINSTTTPVPSDTPVDVPPSVQGDTTDQPSNRTNNAQPDQTKTSLPAAKSGNYKVSSIVDGDTIRVALDGNRTEAVRLIGIDTPELHDPRKSVQCYATEATDYVRSILQNKTVTLVSDPSQQDRDKYSRLLRYVFLPDGSNLNKQIVAEGYGYEYTYNTPYKYQAEFRQAQSSARTAQRGLWSPSTCNGVTS